MPIRAMTETVNTGRPFFGPDTEEQTRINDSLGREHWRIMGHINGKLIYGATKEEMTISWPPANGIDA